MVDVQDSPQTFTMPDKQSAQEQDLTKIQHKMELINKMKKYAEDNTISKHASDKL